MLGFLVLTAVTFSLFGFIIGIWADGFEKLQVIPLLVITPLTFLGGSFYSINVLPPVWQTITLLIRWCISDSSLLELLRDRRCQRGPEPRHDTRLPPICMALVWWIFRTGYGSRTGGRTAGPCPDGAQRNSPVRVPLCANCSREKAYPSRGRKAAGRRRRPPHSPPVMRIVQSPDTFSRCRPAPPQETHALHHPRLGPGPPRQVSRLHPPSSSHARLSARFRHSSLPDSAQPRSRNDRNSKDKRVVPKILPGAATIVSPQKSPRKLILHDYLRGIKHRRPGYAGQGQAMSLMVSPPTDCFRPFGEEADANGAHLSLFRGSGCSMIRSSPDGREFWSAFGTPITY